MLNKQFRESHNQIMATENDPQARLVSFLPFAYPAGKLMRLHLWLKSSAQKAKDMFSVTLKELVELGFDPSV